MVERSPACDLRNLVELRVGQNPSVKQRDEHRGLGDVLADVMCVSHRSRVV